MPANITLYSNDEPIRLLELGEMIMPETEESLLEGEPHRIRGENSGNTILRRLSLHVLGEGADKVQLSIDNDGEPGVWAAPGQPILIDQDRVHPEEEFFFWVRGVFSAEDAEDEHDFKLKFKAISGVSGV